MSEDKDGGGRGRATMSIDIEEMVRMAGERAGWVLVNRKVITTPAGMDDIVTITRHTRDAQFIAKVPATITALHQQVQDLEAANAALQAQVGEWQGVRLPDESPPLHYANDEAKYFRFEAYEKVEALVRMPLVKQMRFGKDKKEGLVETEWQGGNSPFFGYRIPHEQVIGWRPLPDESPTAAESEE